MGKKRFWQFRNSETEPTTGELLLYGEISNYSWWGDEVTPKQFKEELDALGDISLLKVSINSPGGDVFAGQAIHSMLKRHKAQVDMYIDGLAASAASVVAMAGDTIYMPRNAMMMIHNAWTWGVGYAADFRKLADDLDKIGESIIAAYQAKVELSKEEIQAIMDAETWLTAEEAVEQGFADVLEEEKVVAASLKGRTLVLNGMGIDLSKYKNPPRLIQASTEGQPNNDGLPSALVALARAKKLKNI